MRKAVSRGAAKEAALYFDEVLPSDLVTSSLGRAGVIPDVQDSAFPMGGHPRELDILKSLLPNVSNPIKLLRENYILEFANFIVRLTALAPEMAEECQIQSKNVIEDAQTIFGIDLSLATVSRNPALTLNKIAETRSTFLTTIGFSEAPEWVLDTSFRWRDESLPAPQEQSMFALSLKNLYLVDASKLTWEQIIEFRKDRETRSALSQLRLFFQDELAGKDISYAADKLAVLMDEHERAARMWGFETVRQSLSVAFTHKSMIATAAGSIAASMAGATLPAAAAATLLIPLGSFGLEFTKAAIDAARAQPKEPTKYLTRLKELAGKVA